MSQFNVKTIDLAGQQHYAETVFPLVFCSDQQASKAVIADWIGEHRDQIEEQLALTGAILFRGFGLKDDRDFDDFIRAFDWPNFTYAESLSNAVRRNRTELVFTANEAPPTVSIFLHHEMAQTPVYPSKLLFSVSTRLKAAVLPPFAVQIFCCNNFASSCRSLLPIARIKVCAIPRPCLW